MQNYRKYHFPFTYYLFIPTEMTKFPDKAQVSCTTKQRCVQKQCNISYKTLPTAQYYLPIEQKYHISPKFLKSIRYNVS